MTSYVSHQVAQIYSACDNPRVKHALFSATLGSGVEEFCQAHLDTPVRIIIGLPWVLVVVVVASFPGSCVGGGYSPLH